MTAKSYSLLELNEYLKRVLALNVRDAVWVKCEIAQANVTRGHFYLDLVEKRGDEVVAKSKAIIWQREVNKLSKKLKGTLPQILQPGIQALLMVKVDFHEVFGLKFIVSDIDQEFSLGQLELKKRAVIAGLSQRGLLDKNKRHIFPLVPQRIAVLSSERAAGWKDFLAHLENNSYGYRFDITLFSASVQGELAAGELVTQIRNIGKRHHDFDVIAIIRGGGAKLDLLAFDDERLCTEIANNPLPVVTGIGHEIDETIADLVANLSLKTPTAVAGFLIEAMIRFESHLNRITQQLELAVKGRLHTEKLRLNNLEQHIRLLAKQQIKREFLVIDNLEQSLHLLNPRTILNKGYSLTVKGNLIVKNADQVTPGDEIITHLKKGSIKSTAK